MKSKRSSALHGLVALSLLATAGVTLAAENPAPGASAPGMHAPSKRFDPVQHTQKRLDGLEAKLNLKEDQKAAWKTYSHAALDRAQERSAKMQALHERRDTVGNGDAGTDLDTASKLDKAAAMMRDRADELQKVAQDTRAFQQVLSPEQQAIFDLYWKSQQRAGRGGHRPA
jgi:Spy/CpxP family protein refolding chaperone